MEFASLGTLINFSDKTQSFSVNPNIIKFEEFIRQPATFFKESSLSNDSVEMNLFHNKDIDNILKKEYYNEEYLKKFILQISDALEYRIYIFTR